MSVDPQEWTVELTEAVRDYLLNELPDDVAPYLFRRDAETLKIAASKREAVDALIARTEPWEVAIEVQLAAVKAVPTLDELIGHLYGWPSEEERSNAEEWLLEHASDDVLKTLLEGVSGRRFNPFGFSLYDLTHEYQPLQLLIAWRQAKWPGPSDLTDAEWELIVPLLPYGPNALARSEGGRAHLRQLFNGMLYRYRYGTGWSDIPQRYGDHREIRQRHRNFKYIQRVFRRMLAALENTAEAERLLEWLRHVEPEAQAVKRR